MQSNNNVIFLLSINGDLSLWSSRLVTNTGTLSGIAADFTGVGSKWPTVNPLLMAGQLYNSWVTFHTPHSLLQRYNGLFKDPCPDRYALNWRSLSLVSTYSAFLFLMHPGMMFLLSNRSVQMIPTYHVSRCHMCWLSNAGNVCKARAILTTAWLSPFAEMSNS